MLSGNCNWAIFVIGARVETNWGQMVWPVGWKRHTYSIMMWILTVLMIWKDLMVTGPSWPDTQRINEMEHNCIGNGCADYVPLSIQHHHPHLMFCFPPGFRVELHYTLWEILMDGVVKCQYNRLLLVILILILYLFFFFLKTALPVPPQLNLFRQFPVDVQQSLICQNDGALFNSGCVNIFCSNILVIWTGGECGWILRRTLDLFLLSFYLYARWTFISS